MGYWQDLRSPQQIRHNKGKYKTLRTEGVVLKSDYLYSLAKDLVLQDFSILCIHELDTHLGKRFKTTEDLQTYIRVTRQNEKMQQLFNLSNDKQISIDDKIRYGKNIKAIQFMKCLASSQPLLPMINEILIQEHRIPLEIDLSESTQFKTFLLDSLDKSKQKSESELGDYLSERCGTGIGPHLYFEMICEYFKLNDVSLTPINDHHYVIQMADLLKHKLKKITK